MLAETDTQKQSGTRVFPWARPKNADVSFVHLGGEAPDSCCDSLEKRLRWILATFCRKAASAGSLKAGDPILSNPFVKRFSFLGLSKKRFTYVEKIIVDNAL